MIPATVKTLFDRPPATGPARPGDVSREAGEVLRRLHVGPLTLGDCIDLSTSSADLARWIVELRDGGHAIRREADELGRVRYILDSGPEAGMDPTAPSGCGRERCEEEAARQAAGMMECET